MSAIILGLIFGIFLASGQAQASAEELAQETAGKCSTAMADFKAKGAVLRAFREENERRKGRASGCIYLRFQMEYLVEAGRMLKLCEPLHHPTPALLIEQGQDLLQRTKDFHKKYCAQANLLKAH